VSRKKKPRKISLCGRSVTGERPSARVGVFSTPIPLASCSTKASVAILPV
jgi:hypothetical protein